MGGRYDLELILGDDRFDQGVRRSLGSITIDLEYDEPKRNPEGIYASLPEKHLTHATRKKHANALISTAFTACHVGLFATWLAAVSHIFTQIAPKIFSNVSSQWVICFNANISLLFSDATSFLFKCAFHAGFGAILAVLVLYWTSIDIFTGFAYLFIIAIPTMIVGQRALKAVASKRLRLIKID